MGRAAGNQRADLLLQVGVLGQHQGAPAGRARGRGPDFDAASASGIVGHSDIEVTMRIYAHTSLDDKRAALRKIGDALG
ncbi:hypothetical protein [Actinomadura sp. 7K507]|uniref:hypothetical protein n=1 Tax=Actinomadura sp. 7K507 TaxID=2530365 RepID=UPI00105361BD|nr:hypothetical protein [Actinomadura sp. 7K507]TDC86446.1 hypothetical protein E1285_23375 [Actinomadura sp. 7K507]